MRIGVPGEFHEDRWQRTAEDSERCMLPRTREVGGTHRIQVIAWQSVLLTGLRHDTSSHNHLSGIPAWRRSHLSGLRHGHPAHRYLSGIPAWQSVLLIVLRLGDIAHRCLSGIPAWRSDTKPMPNRSMNGVNGWLRHGVPAPKHLRGWFCAMNTDLETSVSGKGSSYGSEHRERISSPCNSGFNGKFCLRYRLHFIIFASECSEYIRGTRKRQEHLRANRRRTGNAIREGSGLCYRQN